MKPPQKLAGRPQNVSPIRCVRSVGRGVMKLNSLQDLLVSELQDLLGAERQLLQAFPKLLKRITHPELRKCVEQHFQDSKKQETRLEKCFQKLGVPVVAGRSHGIIGMISAWSEFESTEAQPDVLDAAIISMIQHMEHYEIAGYGCARAFAEVLDEAGVAELLQETLEEEEECDRRLTRLAETVVNVDAETHSR